MSNAMKRIEAAQYYLLNAEPFYGSLGLRLIQELITKESNRAIKTAATDGVRIFWNEAFVAELTDKELRGCYLHEIMHAAHGHLWSLPLNDRANMACDYAINLVIDDMSKGANGARQIDIALPKGVLLDERYRGQTEEQIYAVLPDPPAGYQDAMGGMTEPEDGEGSSDHKARLAESWNQAVLQASLVSKIAGGHVPDYAQIQIARMQARVIDWKQALQDFAADIVQARNDWARSSRRGASAACIMPKRKLSDKRALIVVRDTSGSIACDSVLLGMINAGIEGLLDSGLVAKIYLIDADTSIRAKYALEEGDIVPDMCQGGGGTEFDDALALLNDPEYDDAAGLVYFTDLEGPSPAVRVDKPVLWVATPNASPFDMPYGTFVKIS